MSLRCEQAAVHAANLPIPKMKLRRFCFGFLLSIFRSFYHSSRHLLALPDFYNISFYCSMRYSYVWYFPLCVFSANPVDSCPILQLPRYTIPQPPCVPFLILLLFSPSFPMFRFSCLFVSLRRCPYAKVCPFS